MHVRSVHNSTILSSGALCAIAITACVSTDASNVTATGAKQVPRPEIETEVVGELRVSIEEDFTNGRSTTLYEVAVGGAARATRLLFQDSLPQHVRTGDIVRARGRRVGDRLDTDEIQLMAPKQGGSGSGGTGGGGGNGQGNLSGSRTVAVILINLLDGDSKLTATDAERIMWGLEDSANDMFMESSRGAVEFVADGNRDGKADVFGPFDVGANGSGLCAYSSWSGAARTAATSAGHDLSGYDHYVYVLPSGNGCRFGGLADLSGNNVWLNVTHEFALAHELGHNVGMHHAARDSDNDGIVESAYGDASCFMGASYRNVLLNAPHSHQLGFVGGSAVVAGSTNAGVHQYQLHPLASATGVNAVMLLKQDNGDFYYLSARDSASYDANLPESYRDGVSIHRYAGSGSTMTVYITTLTDGESFVDDVNGFTITQQGVDPSTGVVDVQVTVVPTCGARAPHLSVASYAGDYQRSNTVGMRDVSRYVVTIGNRDDAECGPVQFTLSTAGVPNTMTHAFAQPTAVLGPGESMTTELQVNTGDTADGTYVFDVVVADGDGVHPAHPAKDTWARMVIDSSTLIPAPPTNLRASFTTSKGRFRVTWQWQASPSPEVTNYRVYLDDPVMPRYVGSAASTSYTRYWEAGTYTFYVAAETNSGKLSPLSDPVHITIAKGGKK